MELFHSSFKFSAMLGIFGEIDRVLNGQLGMRSILHLGILKCLAKKSIDAKITKCHKVLSTMLCTCLYLKGCY